MEGIVVDGITKRFNSFTAVDRLSFSVERGGIFGLLGPNGAGKTTTVRMLACLTSPTSGYANVAGHDITGDPASVRRSVGMLTENPSLYERLSATENLEFFARAYGMTDGTGISFRIKELLDLFGLWERRNDKAGVFSKGMKQKLAIARSVIHNPPVLFLDEPTSGLDPEGAKLIRDMVVELSQRERRTILLCTHRLEDAEKICNRVVIMAKGTAKILGTPEELRGSMAVKPKIEVRVKGKGVGYADRLKRVEGVTVVEDYNGRLLIGADNVQDVTPQVVKALVEGGAMVTAVNMFLPSLEDAYMRLIKEGS